MLVIFTKKTDYHAKILNIGFRYITAANYNKFTKYIVANKIKSEGLIDKPTISGFINSAYLDKKKKVATLGTKV